MKILFKCFVALVLSTSILSCSSDRINEDLNIIKPLIKKFTLEKTEVSVHTNSSETIKITSGNDDYTISNKGEEFAIVKLSDDKKSLVVKGIKKGNTSVNITDNVSKTTFTINIKVMIPTIPYQQELPSINLNETNRDAVIKAGNESIKRYKQYLNEVNKLPELPDKDIYKMQKKNWIFSRTYAPSYEERFLNNSKVPNFDIKKLVDPDYHDILIYGEGFTIIELLARKSEEFSKQYPNNQEIKTFINKTFSGEYSSQDGNDFITGLNRDFIKEYNKIVDLVNRLNQE